MSTLSPLPQESPDSTRHNRRAFLTKAAGAGAMVAGASLLSSSARAADTPEVAAAVKAIFTVARTAEQLAVTFYTNGVNNAAALGLVGVNLDAIKAALIEEQIHQTLFTAQGGDSLADTFSFPDGPSTFTDPAKFIKALQQLEGAFDSAFLQAVKEFAQLGHPELSQIATQIAMVESEHRAVARAIFAQEPADNWAYAPVLIDKVADAPAVLTAAGYLSPVAGNTYTYAAPDFTSAALKPVYDMIINKAPTDKMTA